MTRFTDSPYEWTMKQIPKPAAPSRPQPPPAPHFCQGCKRYGESCLRPCYRDLQKPGVRL